MDTVFLFTQRDYAFLGENLLDFVLSRFYYAVNIVY